MNCWKKNDRASATAVWGAAACFLDSLATLALPGRGYGIRYEYGMFKQNIVNGQQMESPDYWLEYGNPWEFPRHNTRYKVRFGGRVQQEGAKARWLETEDRGHRLRSGDPRFRHRRHQHPAAVGAQASNGSTSANSTGRLFRRSGG